MTATGDLREQLIHARKQGALPFPKGTPWRERVQADENGCLIWQGSIDKSGYGSWGSRKESRLAHRRVWIAERGPLPAGLTLDHLCRNRSCVNPDHLEPVTRGENVLRGVSGPAENARKSECAYGHPLSGPNLYVYPNGRWRKCRTCMERTAADGYRRRRSAGLPK